MYSVLKEANMKSSEIYEELKVEVTHRASIYYRRVGIVKSFQCSPKNGAVSKVVVKFLNDNTVHTFAVGSLQPHEVMC